MRFTKALSLLLVAALLCGLMPAGVAEPVAPVADIKTVSGYEITYEQLMNGGETPETATLEAAPDSFEGDAPSGPDVEKIVNVVSKLTPEQKAQLLDRKVVEPRGVFNFPEDTDFDSTEMTNVIVRLEVPSVAEQRVLSALEGKYISEEKAEQRAEESHDDFLEEMDEVAKQPPMLGAKKTPVDYAVTGEWSLVSNGIALTVPANMISEIASLPSVRAVTPDGILTTDEQTTADGMVSTNGGTFDAQATTISHGMQDSREDLQIDYINETLGLDGEGVKVALIDTGLDYNHPDLRDTFIGGYDFVDEDDDPMEATYKDWLALEAANPGKHALFDASGHSYFTYHGTHVGSIIAARGVNDSPFATTGIAPKANLRVYRVLGPYGSGQQSWTEKAINRAVADECQVINLSLGSNYNSPYSYEAATCDWTTIYYGVVNCIASGNNGVNVSTLQPIWYSVGDPGTSAFSITVANGTLGAVKYELVTARVSNSGQTVKLYVMASNFETDYVPEGTKGYLKELGCDLVFDPDKGYEYVYIPGNGQAADYDAQGIQKGDLVGKMAIVCRGGDTFKNLLATSKEYGASALAVINTDEAYLNNTSITGFDFDLAPAYGLKQSEKSAIETNYFESKELGYKTYLSFTHFGRESQPSGVDWTSSAGPVKEVYHIKPDITAPGAGILACIPAYDRNADYNDEDYSLAYDRMVGTSMAAPHITGIVALLLQSDPTLTPLEIKARIMNTANTMDSEKSVFTSGAGTVDPLRAIQTKVYATARYDVYHVDRDTEAEIMMPSDMPMLSFGKTLANVNDATTDSTVIPVTLHNEGTTAKTYNLAVVKNDDTGFSASMTQLGVSLILGDGTQTSVTVPAGATASFTAKMRYPKAAYGKIFEGMLVMTNAADATDTIRMPFAGFVFSTEARVIYSYPTRPILSPLPLAETTDNKGGRFMSFTRSTDMSDLFLEYTYGIKTMTMALYDIETGDIFGIASSYDEADFTAHFESKIGYPEIGFTFFDDAMFLEYVPCDNELNILDGGTKRTLDVGIYGAKLLLTAESDRAFEHELMHVAVDDSLPTLTFDDPRIVNNGTVLFDESQKLYRLEGTMWHQLSKDLADMGQTYDCVYGKTPFAQNHALFLSLRSYITPDEDDYESGFFWAPIDTSKAEFSNYFVTLNTYAASRFTNQYYYIPVPTSSGNYSSNMYAGVNQTPVYTVHFTKSKKLACVNAWLDGPSAEVTCKWYDSANNLLTDTTDPMEGGGFFSAAPPVGAGRVEISAPGYHTVTVPYTHTHEQTIVLPDVTLTEAAETLTGIAIDKPLLALVVGASETLTPVFTPVKAIDKDVVWSSNNTAVATVDAAGKVTAKSKGTAVITCKSAGNAAIFGTSTVTVSNPPPSSVALNQNMAVLTVGEKATLTTTVLPAITENKTVTWTTSNASVATVTDGVVTAKAAGAALVTATTNVGGKAAICQVVVSAAPVVEIVTNTQMNTAIAAAPKGSGNKPTTVSIPFNATGGTVEIEKTAIGTLKNSGAAKLAVGTGALKVSLDATAVAAVNAKATGNVTVSAISRPLDSKTKYLLESVNGSKVFDVSIKSDNTAITNLNNGAITVSMPYTPAAGEDVNAIVVYMLDQGSNFVKVTNSKYDAKTKTVTVTLRQPASLVIANNAIFFTDVPKPAWFYPYVQQAASRGIVNGVGNYLFRPNNTLTRAEYVQMIYNALKLPSSSAKAYDDVASGMWYTRCIQSAKAAGLLAAFGGGKFYPNQRITREEMAVIAAAVLKRNNIPVTASGVVLSKVYSDAGSIGAAYRDAVVVMYDAQIMRGASGKFSPKGNALRSEATKVLLLLAQMVY